MEFRKTDSITVKSAVDPYVLNAQIHSVQSIRIQQDNRSRLNETAPACFRKSITRRLLLGYLYPVIAFVREIELDGVVSRLGKLKIGAIVAGEVFIVRST